MRRTESVILLTGAAGFIGSYLLGYLNGLGYTHIILSDDFSREDKSPNFESKQFSVRIDREELLFWLEQNRPPLDAVFHMGARTDTTEFDYRVHERLNFQFSRDIWNYCTRQQIPLIYASSAATYGAGERGYADDHLLVDQLMPLNPYGVSKNEFDKWALRQEQSPPRWAGLKFFNVYGPNEYHKGRMASVIFHAFRQISETGKMKLFRSHRPDYADGQQRRDFIYVKDVAASCVWLLENEAASGLYNLGTGRARSFEDLVKAVFAAMDRPPVIEYIPIPEDIRDTYQYFTEAKMEKLRATGCPAGFHSLEEGVSDYVRNYLLPQRYY